MVTSLSVLITQLSELMKETILSGSSFTCSSVTFSHQCDGHDAQSNAEVLLGVIPAMMLQDGSGNSKFDVLLKKATITFSTNI